MTPFPEIVKGLELLVSLRNDAEKFLRISDHLIGAGFQQGFSRSFPVALTSYYYLNKTIDIEGGNYDYWSSKGN